MTLRQRENQSTITEFHLMGFQDLHRTRILVFLVFLVIYLATVAGNLLIIALVSYTPQLHSPMYFFLSNLSLADILQTTNIVPNLLHIILKEGGAMSIISCITQFYVFGALSVTECLTLTAMSYDRYLAICDPLHYTTIMNFKCCIHLGIVSWFVGFMLTLIIATMIYNLHFCDSNVIDHFFCDFYPIVQLSCSDTTIVKLMVYVIATPETVIETAFIIGTYICIFISILRISSDAERGKAFSTCSSHLSVVCTYYGSLIFIYVTPSRGYTFNINKVLSLLYTVVTPLLNPVIYSLRNKEIKKALKKWIDKNKFFANGIIRCY